MMKRVLSIEIGNLDTKICEISYNGKKKKVLNSCVFKTPYDTVEDGYVRDKSTFCKALKDVIRQEKFKTNKVIFSITSTKIYTKEIIIPYVQQKKIKDVIQTNIEEYLPFSISEYVLNYSVIEKVKSNNEKKIRVLLIAMPDTMVKNYYSTAQMADLEIESLDYNGNSVYQILRTIPTKGINVYIQLKEQSTIISILREHVLVLQRTISFGTNEILQTVMDRNYGVITNENEAFELLKNADYINAYVNQNEEKRKENDKNESSGGDYYLEESLAEAAVTKEQNIDTRYKEEQITDQEMNHNTKLQEESSNEEASGRVEYASEQNKESTPNHFDEIKQEQTREAVADLVNYLVSSISRVVDYYINQGGTAIENVFLLDQGSEFKGIQAYMQKEMGIFPQMLHEFQGVKHGKKVGAYLENPSNFLSCIGAIMDPIGFQPKDLVAKKVNQSSLKETIVIVFLCVTGSVILYMTSQHDLKVAKDDLEESKAIFAGLPTGEATNAEFDEAISQLEQLEELHKGTKTNVESIYELMGVLEDNLVTITEIDSMQVTNEAISMSVELPSKETAARLIQQFDQLVTYFKEVNISGITENKNEDGTSSVTFSIVFVLKDLTESEGE